MNTSYTTHVFIPNTAVFGPTKLIETTIASTRMSFTADDSFTARMMIALEY